MSIKKPVTPPTSCADGQHAIQPDGVRCFCGFYRHVPDVVPSNMRERIALAMPYWLWRIFSIGMKDHMLENLNLWQLSEISQTPDGALDQKGRYVKRVAVKLIEEYKTGETKKLR